MFGVEWENGTFQRKIWKWGISRKKHVTSFKKEKEPKLKLFEFGAFEMPHFEEKMPSIG